MDFDILSTESYLTLNYGKLSFSNLVLWNGDIVLVFLVSRVEMYLCTVWRMRLIGNQSSEIGIDHLPCECGLYHQALFYKGEAGLSSKGFQCAD